MRKLIALLAVVASAAPLSQAAMAAPTPGQGPTITVEGDRIICRRAVRTSSRMRSGRICRSQAEWRANGVAMSSARDGVDGTENEFRTFHETIPENDRFEAPVTGGAGPY